jgi:predicted glutamine amidotransferase
LCGLVGSAGKLTAETDKLLRKLLIIDSIRGEHSTGIAAIDPQGVTRIAKAVGNPFNLFDTKAYDLAVQKFNRVVIGHNRYATQGEVNKKNAHPYDFDTLVGAHNGTLHNKHQLLDSKDFQVDSENLYHHMEQEGLPSLMSTIRGAWSLVWWDKKEETLNFLRNEERPMWLLFSTDGELMLWASEPEMLSVIQQQTNIKWEEPRSTKVNHHYSFKIGMDRKIQAPDVVYCPSTAKPPVAVSYHQQNFPTGPTGNKPSTTSSEAPKAVVSAVAAWPYPADNKVVELGKHRVAPQTAKKVLPSSDSYSGQKGVLLEVLAKKTDHRGSEYYVCFDAVDRKQQVRLYIKRTDTVNLLHKEITATIGRRIVDVGEGVYHKVEHGSVKLNQREEHAEYFLDARKKKLSEKEWNAKYPKCGWCYAPLDPRDPNMFTDSTDCICPTCAQDHEVQGYVKFIN